MSIGYQVYYDIKANDELCFSSTTCKSFGHTKKAPRLQKSVMSLERSWSCEVLKHDKTQKSSTFL